MLVSDAIFPYAPAGVVPDSFALSRRMLELLRSAALISLMVLGIIKGGSRTSNFGSYKQQHKPIIPSPHSGIGYKKKIHQ